MDHTLADQHECRVTPARGSGVGRNRRNGQRGEGVSRSPCTAAGLSRPPTARRTPMTRSLPRPAPHAPPRRRDAVRADLLASLVVFLVAVPLSLGIALA